MPSRPCRGLTFLLLFCCDFLPAPVPRSTTPFGTDTCRPFGWGSQQLSEENPNFVRERCVCMKRSLQHR